MSTITTRAAKGSPLTNAEVDLNFTSLNTDKAELSGAAFTGAITTTSTVDGRDVATDGSKLDGIEASADVTDTTNVTAAGALMDSEVTNLAQVKAFDSADYATAAQGTTADAALPKAGGAMTGAITTNSTFDGRDVATDGTKLDGIEASADVTDTTNVTAAGALMDSELTSIASVKALDQGVATTDSPDFAALNVNGTATADKVTIGTSSASNGKLTLEGVDGGDSAGIYFNNTTATNGKSYSLSSGNSGEFMLYDRTSSAYRLFVSSAGNVGINNSSPSANLEITQSGNNVGLLVAGGGYNYTAKFESSDAEANIIIEDSNSTNNGNMIGVATNDMYFITNATERMRISSTGAATFNSSVTAGGQLTSARGSDTGTYGFRHEGAGKYMRMGVANASFAYFETDANGGFSFEGDVSVANKIIHAGDTNTYIDFTSDVLDLYSGGSLGVRIQPTAVTINETGADYDFRVESDSNTHMLFVDGGNNLVGVGTSNPVAPFAVGGAGRRIEVDGASGVIRGFDRSASWAGIDFEASAYTFDCSAARMMDISSSGVVINEDSADADFRVESNGSDYAFFVDGSTNNIGIQSGTEWAIVGGGNGTSSSGSSIDMGYDATIYGGSAYWAGGVDIGTNFWRDASGYHYKRTSRQATAYQQSSQGASHAFYSQTTGNAGAIISWNSLLYMDRTQTIFNETGADTDFRVESDNSANALFINGADGTVNVGGIVAGAGAQSGIALSGVNTDSNIYVRHAYGTGSGSRFMAFTYNTSELGSITQHGTSQVLFNVSSDQRLKENIADADDAGSKIDAIQVRKYDWKADGLHQDYGMIAQELQAVVPEAVSGSADSEEMMGVDYSKLVPMLIKEIQSLRARVADLES